MSRLPIRVRLTAVFVAVMGGGLVIIGLFLYYRTEHNLDTAINQALRARQGALREFARAARADPRAAIPPGERFAQILRVDGGVISSRPDSTRPALTPAEAARAARRLGTVERHEQVRLLAGPASWHGRRVVALVGSSLADRERALEGLGGALLIGSPLALLLAAAIGYATASAALAPVESIRRRAEGISRAHAEVRLPVPVASDELQRLALTLNGMLKRLADTAAHERSFAANASHELRTPLAALRAELELARRHARTEEEFRAALDLAIQDSDRLAALADDLLVLARADDPPPRSRETVDIDDLLVAIANELGHSQGSRGRELTARPSGLTTVGDARSIERAVRNLVDNALLHGAGNVTLGADLTAAESIEVWVRDEGSLADPALSREGFTRFARGPGAGTLPGAGLGLSIVQAIAEEHGGNALLQSLPEGGVQASMVLPNAVT